MQYIYPDGRSDAPRVDIEAITSLLRQQKKCFFHFSLNNFVDEWCRVLYETYAREKDAIFHLPYGIWYNKGITLPNSEITLHFDICKAEKIASNMEEKYAPLSRFSTETETGEPIEYSDESSELNKYDYASISKPIFLIPYYLGSPHRRYLVIDGNHRVTAFRSRKKDTIMVKELDYKSASCLLTTDFERAVYAMTCELAVRPSQKLYRASLVYTFTSRE